MSCKPGVAGSIPCFSIKPLLVEPSGASSHIKNTQIINPPGPVLVTTHGKATKSFFFFLKIPSREITQTRKEGTIIASDNLSDL